VVAWLLAETDHAIAAARETDHMPTLLFALTGTSFTHMCCRDYATAIMHLDECIALADGKVPFWQIFASAQRGCVLAQTGKAAEAIETISAATAGATRNRGNSLYVVSTFAFSFGLAEIGKFDDARRCLGEAMTAVEITEEGWYLAEINRIAGEIALKTPEPDAAEAQAYFERALTVARQQQAKSLELRAAMSHAHLWRDRASRRKLAICLLRSTAGSLKALRRAI